MAAKNPWPRPVWSPCRNQACEPRADGEPGNVLRRGTMADRALEGRAFRQALGQFPTGVCVVTCAVDGALLGMTMSSFNSLSLEPPLVLFSIDRRAASLPLWQKAE